MKIEWTIKKERGRFRPQLIYSTTWEKWEESLHPARAKVYIPIGYSQTSDDYLSEDDTTTKKELIYSTQMNGAKKSFFLRYGANPIMEIKDLFLALVNEHEQLIKNAYDELPIDKADLIETSDDLKKYVAPGLTAQRMKNGK